MELSAPNLVQILAAATAGETAREASAQLEIWQKQSGYHASLQDACFSSQLEPEVRFQALIQLKNGVDKYWRKSANNALSVDEKKHIRSRLLQSNFESDDSLGRSARLVSEMNAVTIAKVARLDFPTEWPDFLSELIAKIGQANQDQLPFLLKIVLETMRGFFTIRLTRPKEALYEQCPSLLKAIGVVVQQSTEAWYEHSSDSLIPLALKKGHMDTGRIAYQCVREIIAVGLKSPHEDPVAVDLWQLSVRHLEMGMEQRTKFNRETNPHFLVCLYEWLEGLANLHYGVADSCPASFGLFPDSPKLVHMYFAYATDLRKQHRLSYTDNLLVDDHDHDAKLSEHFELRSLQLLRLCFKMAFQPSVTYNYNKAGQATSAEARQIIKDRLLFESYIASIMKELIETYLVYVAEDLSHWDMDPEDFEMREEGGESNIEIVRSCAERLLMDLVRTHKNLAKEMIAHYAAKPVETVNQKDAIMSAIGICAAVIHDDFDFNSYLAHNIMPDLREQQNQDYRILRRRAIIVIVQWSYVNLSDESRKLSYKIFDFILAQNQTRRDHVVRITAGKKLKDLADEWSFSATEFAPYAQSIFPNLVSLAALVEMSETKLSLLSSIATLVERMQLEIVPFARELITLLSHLWAETELHLNGEMMKQHIMRTIKILACSLDKESNWLQPYILPALHEVFQPDSGLTLFLVDDALDLLTHIIRNDPGPPSAQLLSFIPLVLPFVSSTSEDELLERALDVIFAYALISPEAMLEKSNRQQLFGLLAPLTEQQKGFRLNTIYDILDSLLRSCSAQELSAQFVEVIEDLVGSEILLRPLNRVQEKWEAAQVTGPKAKSAPEWRTAPYDFELFARVIIADTSAFVSTIDFWCQQHNVTRETMMQRFIDELSANIDNIGDFKNSKLVTLAVTKLLDVRENWILDKLQDLLVLWTSSILEVRESDENPMIDSLVIPPDDQKPLYGATQHEQRIANLNYTDPVSKINLMEYVRSQLMSVIQACGGESAFQDQWLCNVDREVVNGFMALGIMQ